MDPPSPLLLPFYCCIQSELVYCPYCVRPIRPSEIAARAGGRKEHDHPHPGRVLSGQRAGCGGWKLKFVKTVPEKDNIERKENCACAYSAPAPRCTTKDLQSASMPSKSIAASRSSSVISATAAGAAAVVVAVAVANGAPPPPLAFVSIFSPVRNSRLFSKYWFGCCKAKSWWGSEIP